jgi:hypothetical protein
MCVLNFEAFASDVFPSKTFGIDKKPFVLINGNKILFTVNPNFCLKNLGVSYVHGQTILCKLRIAEKTKYLGGIILHNLYASEVVDRGGTISLYYKSKSLPKNNSKPELIDDIKKLPKETINITDSSHYLSAIEFLIQIDTQKLKRYGLYYLVITPNFLGYKNGLNDDVLHNDGLRCDFAYPIYILPPCRSGTIYKSLEKQNPGEKLNENAKEAFSFFSGSADFYLPKHKFFIYSAYSLSPIRDINYVIAILENRNSPAKKRLKNVRLELEKLHKNHNMVIRDVSVHAPHSVRMLEILKLTKNTISFEEQLERYMEVKKIFSQTTDNDEIIYQLLLLAKSYDTAENKAAYDAVFAELAKLKKLEKEKLKKEKPNKPNGDPTPPQKPQEKVKAPVSEKSKTAK